MDKKIKYNVTIVGATDITVAANDQAANFKPIENFGTLNDIFNEVSEKTAPYNFS